MIYSVTIHTQYDNALLSEIIEGAKHKYYETTEIHNVYETNDGIVIIFRASNPDSMITSILYHTNSKFEISSLGFKERLKMMFDKYTSHDKKENNKEVNDIG